MNKEKYARLCIVLDHETDRALRFVAAAAETGVSALVRELITVPALAMADAMGAAIAAKTPAERAAVEETLDLFVEGQYGSYLEQRSRRHG